MHLIPQTTPLWLAQDEDGPIAVGRIIGWQVGEGWTPIVSFVGEDGRMQEVGYPDEEAFIGTTREEAVAALRQHLGNCDGRTTMIGVTVEPCPACGAEAWLFKPLDRHIHTNAAPNDDCWLKMSRGIDADAEPVIGKRPTNNRLHELAYDAIRAVMPEEVLPKWAARMTADAVTLGTLDDILVWAPDTPVAEVCRQQRVAWINERLERNKRPTLPAVKLTPAIRAAAAAVAAHLMKEKAK